MTKPAETFQGRRRALIPCLYMSETPIAFHLEVLKAASLALRTDLRHRCSREQSIHTPPHTRRNAREDVLECGTAAKAGQAVGGLSCGGKPIELRPGLKTYCAG